MSPEEIKRKYQDMLNNEILLGPEIADMIEATPVHERTEQEAAWLQRYNEDMATFIEKKPVHDRSEWQTQWLQRWKGAE
jgi:hypothetical protein